MCVRACGQNQEGYRENVLACAQVWVCVLANITVKRQPHALERVKVVRARFGVKILLASLRRGVPGSLEGVYSHCSKIWLKPSLVSVWQPASCFRVSSVRVLLGRGFPRRLLGAHSPWGYTLEANRLWSVLVLEGCKPKRTGTLRDNIWVRLQLVWYHVWSDSTVVPVTAWDNLLAQTEVFPRGSLY